MSEFPYRFFGNIKFIDDFNHNISENRRRHSYDCSIFDCSTNCAPDICSDVIVTKQKKIKELGVDHLVKE